MSARLQESFEAIDGGGQVLSSEADPEVIAREPEPGGGQEQDALGLDESLGEQVDRFVVEEARKADRAAPRSDPGEPVGPLREEPVEAREIRVDDPPGPG